MNRFKRSVLAVIMTTIFLSVAMGTSPFASERVVCTVEVLSEQSANIKLSWYDKTLTDSIRITGWTLVDSTTLRVTYMTGPKVEPGWDSRKIEGENYKFPMKIQLVEEGQKAVIFTDLPTVQEEKDSILNLYYQGILSGYGDGSFKPINNVTRAEFAKMITMTAQYSLSPVMTSPFKDIKAGYWGLPYITTLAEKEIFKGRANGTFDPTGSITLGEILAVINRTFTLYDGASTYNHTLTKHWSNTDFLTLVQAGIVKPTDSFYYPYKADTKATRVQCAVLLSRVLEQMHQTK